MMLCKDVLTCRAQRLVSSHPKNPSTEWRSFCGSDVMTNNDEAVPLIGYGTGVVGVAELNHKIGEAWREVLADPRAKEEAAKILGIKLSDLEKEIPASPFEVRANEAGLGPVETAILVFVGAVVYDLAKDAAKDAVKAAFRSLWQKVIKNKVEKYLPLGAFGKEVDVNDSGDKKTQ